MSTDYDMEKWYEDLKFHDWYIRRESDLLRHFSGVLDPGLDTNAQKKYRHLVYDLVEEALLHERIPLADSGPDLDTAREAVDRVIIHHTSDVRNNSLSILSAIGLVRQYAIAYLRNGISGHELRGNPIWSGHFKDGKMVFCAYHWLVRSDGTSIRLLADEYIGWHAGSSRINRRSIAIALAGDYQCSDPPAEQLAEVKQILRQHYPDLKGDSIFGHNEVMRGRGCPGKNFLSRWKHDITNDL